MNPPAGTDHRGWLIETMATLTRPARRVLRRVRWFTQARLHPFRRRRALRRVRRRVPIQTVGFVCLGNICRSPYAEYRLRRLLEDAGVGSAVQISSIGFIGPDRPSPEVAQEVARNRGVDLAPHRSRTMDEGFVQGTDLIFVMTARQLQDLRKTHRRPDAIHLGDLTPGPIPARDIPDPYSYPREVFEAAYDRIDAALEPLGRLLAEPRDHS